MQFLSLVQGPQEEPIDIGIAKQHMRITIPDEDDLIRLYISAARRYIERTRRRSLVTQTWDYALDSFPWRDLGFELPLPPLQSITSLTYYDINNSPTVWPSSNYFVDTFNEPGRLMLAANVGWPSSSLGLRPANAVITRFVSGFGPAAQVPLSYKQAMLLLVEHWHEFREPVMAQRGVVPAEVEFTVNALLGGEDIAAVS